MTTADWRAWPDTGHPTPLVTEAWIERVHDSTLNLADDYPDARRIYESGPTIPSPASGSTRSGHAPESRTPAGRDTWVTARLIRAAHMLAQAHSWASWWTDWPGLPWMPEPMYGHHSEECSTCTGVGQSVTIVDLGDTAVPLVGWCVPCASTGVTRNLYPPDFPPSAWEVRSAALQMAGYLSALRLRTPKAHEEHVYVELLRAASAAAGAVRWVSAPLPEVDPPCSNCGRVMYLRSGSLCSGCSNWLAKHGVARPPERWEAA